MSVTVNDVKQVARLARIKMDDADLIKYQDSLNRILDFVGRLDEVDCSKIDNTVQYASTLHERKDVVEPCDPAVMNNAAQKACNMFVVPKMVQ